MKFPQGFEVQLVRPNNGAAYADLTHGADRYVVGIADQPFEVRFTAPRSQFTTPYIRVTLKVDGTDAGIAKLVSANHPSSSFEGFVTICKGETITRQFLFGKPETDTEGSSNTEAVGGTQAGSIDVSFTAVKEVAGCVSVPRSSAPIQSAAVLKPVEGKKWFLKPSLSTQQGQATTSRVNYNTRKYDAVRVVATCSMRMESAAILILRKVLNPDFPLHQAIIDRSQAPDEHEGSSDQNIPLVAAGNEATSRVGIKRERTTSSPVNSNRVVKREPNAAPRRSSIEDDECIDLT